MNNKQNEVRELEVIVAESIKNNICEYLELDAKIENIINIEVSSFYGIFIKVLGHKVFSLTRDIDDYNIHHAKIVSPVLRIDDATSEKEIEKYNKQMEFVSLISSKAVFLKLKEIALGNILTLNEEAENIIEC